MIDTKALKEKLDLLGIKYPTKADANQLLTILLGGIDTTPMVHKPAEDVADTSVVKLRQEAMRLVRCSIICLNPVKEDIDGEIISAANDVVGMVRKFVPFHGEAAMSWHIPRILVGVLKARRMLRTTAIKNKMGAEETRTSFVPEFTISELPPLTQEELDAMVEANKH